MRAWWTLALVLPLVFGSGCFVFDEIDKGMKIMDAHSPERNKLKQKEKEEGPVARDGEKKKPGYQETLQAWWKDAKTLSISPGEREASDDPVVACAHGGKTVFTTTSDCLARGGRPS